MEEEEDNSNGSLGIVGIIIVGLLIWGGYSLYSRWTASDKWQLTYLDRSGASSVAGTYDTRAECSQKLEAIRYRAGVDRPECGLNCKASKEFTDMYVCEETFD